MDDSGPRVILSGTGGEQQAATPRGAAGPGYTSVTARTRGAGGAGGAGGFRTAGGAEITRGAIAEAPCVQEFMAIPILTLARFGRWDGLLAEPKPDPEHVYLAGVWHYARGLAFHPVGSDKSISLTLHQTVSGCRVTTTAFAPVVEQCA